MLRTRFRGCLLGLWRSPRGSNKKANKNGQSHPHPWASMLNIPSAGNVVAASNTMGSVSMSNLSDFERLALSRDPIAGSSDIEDIDELFGEIDWATSNFTELEAKWLAELSAIERVICSIDNALSSYLSVG